MTVRVCVDDFAVGEDNLEYVTKGNYPHEWGVIYLVVFHIITGPAVLPREERDSTLVEINKRLDALEIAILLTSQRQASNTNVRNAATDNDEVFGF